MHRLSIRGTQHAQPSRKDIYLVMTAERALFQISKLAYMGLGTHVLGTPPQTYIRYASSILIKKSGAATIIRLEIFAAVTYLAATLAGSFICENG